MDDEDEISSTDSEGFSAKSCNNVLNDDNGIFSLETNIENVMNLQKLLQTEKHKFHKEQRSRIFLENIKSSLEDDVTNSHKKVDVLSKEKLELEKSKIELELKIKQLQLLLTEEKGKRINTEEHLRILKEQLFNGDKFYDTKSGQIRILNSQNGTEDQVVDENKMNVREELKEKEVKWSLELQRYQGEIMKLKSDLNDERRFHEVGQQELKSELQQLRSELERQEKISHREALEHENLLSDLKNKNQQLQKLREQESLQARKFESMIPVSMFEDLKNEKHALIRKLQIKENLLESQKDEKDLVNSQLVMANRLLEEKTDELNEMLRRFNNEKEINSRLKDENLKLKMTNLSLKNSEEKCQQKMNFYEELHKNNDSKSAEMDAKFEGMRKFSELMDSQSQHQALNFQKEAFEFQSKIELLENDLREFQMHFAIVNDQLKLSEENCTRFLKELHVSEQRNVEMTMEMERLQKQLRGLTNESNNLRSSKGHFKNLVQTMKHPQVETIEVGLENVLNVLKTNNAKLKTVLAQPEKEHFEPMTIQVEDRQDDLITQRPKISSNLSKSRKLLKARENINLQNLQENIEAHYQLQLSQKLSKLNEYLKKHELENA